MLQQRVITAIILLAILLPALLASSAVPFTAVVLLLMAAASWEWGRMNSLGQPASLALAALCVMVCAVLWFLGWANQVTPVLWRFVGLLWVLGAALLLRKGVPGWGLIAKSVRLWAGMSALVLAWLAVAQARALGVEFLLSILTLVWMADIAAYFSGRAFGNRKLAPSISPGKSWAGVYGAFAGVALMVWAWVAADRLFGMPVPSLYLSLQRQSWLLLAVGVVFLTTMSVVGDLVESLVKRSVGVKDSSNLLPGHGGVLDRIDALLPVLPLAMMLYSWTITG
jgi:phosphatidate cytidylyltransferase